MTMANSIKQNQKRKQSYDAIFRPARRRRDPKKCLQTYNFTHRISFFLLTDSRLDRTKRNVKNVI